MNKLRKHSRTKTAIPLRQPQGPTIERSIAPESTTPAASTHGLFARGEALLSNLPLVAGDSEMSAFREDLLRPVVQGLVEEFGPTTPSLRMLVELAAHHYVEATLLLRAAMTADHSDGDEIGAGQAETASKRSERHTRLSLQCIEALRRPAPTAVKVAISEATVHVGDQVLAVSDDRRSR